MANIQMTEVYLLNVPLEKDYKHTFYFDSKAEQEKYFKSRVQRRFTNFSYQRTEGYIRIPDKDKSSLISRFDDLYNIGANYLMFRNTSYSQKWFYAFITEIKYIDDGRTDIYFELDVMQTWAFDYMMKPSFVEREHVSDDTIGKHTYPEGLETGEYVCEQHVEDDYYTGSECAYVLASTLKIEKDANAEKFSANGGGLYNGIYSGLRYYRFTNYNALNDVLKAYETAGQSDCVNGIFLIPKVFAKCEGDEDGFDKHDIIWSNNPFSYNVDVDKNEKYMNSYSPLNKKLFCYPYQYLLVSNNNGGSALYRYEDFGQEKCTFKVQGALTPGGSIRLIPLNYKNITEYDEEGLNLGKFPTCNWQTDLYTNWLVQNSKAIENSNLQAMYTGSVGAAANLLSGNVGGAVNSAVNSYFSIKSTMIEKERQSLTPPQANGNTNCGDVIFSSGKNNFHFYKMTCKREYLQKLDKYFMMFGYNVNIVKVPNRCHRKAFWYTKTLDASIDGFNMPQNDLQKIKNIFNEGITFWRDPAQIQNYGQDNSIEITNKSICDLA